MQTLATKIHEPSPPFTTPPRRQEVSAGLPEARNVQLEKTLAVIREIFSDRHEPWQGFPFDRLPYEIRAAIRRSNLMTIKVHIAKARLRGVKREGRMAPMGVLREKEAVA